MTVDELPKHRHTVYVGGKDANWEKATINDVTYVWDYHNAVNVNAATYTGPVHYDHVGYVGQNSPHNTMPPARSVFIWNRTA